jgi:hypothetical protein
VPVTAGTHAALAAVAALAGAALTLSGSPLALAPLAFAALAGCSAGLAYLLAQQASTRRMGGIALAIAQVAMLAWVLALVGTRAALLAGVPALAALSARTIGRRAALYQALALMGVYLAATVAISTRHIAPLVTLRGPASTELDAVLAIVGVLASIAALDALMGRRERALATIQAREHEARSLRELLSAERVRADDDAAALHAALSAALRRRVVFPVHAEGSLSQLAQTVNRTLERIAELNQDHEERLRLESALRQLTRALERSWLGLSWSWPERTDTPVDEIVALLRAPRPSDVPAQSWPDDAPTLVSLPTLRRLREQAATGATDVLAANGETPGNGAGRTVATVPRHRPTMLAETIPPESGISSPRWSVYDSGESSDETDEESEIEERNTEPRDEGEGNG